MPDAHGPWDGSTFGQGQYYRDRGHIEPSGVFGSPAASADAGELGLTAVGFDLSLALGRAHVRGAAYERTGTAWTHTVPANTATSPRDDLIVLRRDLAARTVTPQRLQGTPAATPTDPAVTQNEDGVHELPLFRVRVPANSGTPLVVTDLRRWIDPRTGDLIVPRAKIMATTANGVPLAADGVLGAFSATAKFDSGPQLWDGANKRFVLPWAGRWRIRSFGRWTGGTVGGFVVHRIALGAWPGTWVASDLRNVVTTNETYTAPQFEDDLPAGQIVSMGYWASGGQAALNWTNQGYAYAEYLG